MPYIYIYVCISLSVIVINAEAAQVVTINCQACFTDNMTRTHTTAVFHTIVELFWPGDSMRALCSIYRHSRYRNSTSRRRSQPSLKSQQTHTAVAASVETTEIVVETLSQTIRPRRTKGISDTLYRLLCKCTDSDSQQSDTDRQDMNINHKDNRQQTQAERHTRTCTRIRTHTPLARTHKYTHAHTLHTHTHTHTRARAHIPLERTHKSTHARTHTHTHTHH